jgi:hypothetical protein
MPQETAEKSEADNRVCMIPLAISLALLLKPVLLQEMYEIVFYVLVAGLGHAALHIYDYINRRWHTPFVFSEDFSDKSPRPVSLYRVPGLSGCRNTHS